MRNNTIANCVFHQTPMRKVLASISLESYISQAHDIVCFQIVIFSNIDNGIEIHMRNRNNTIPAVGQIIFF